MPKERLLKPKPDVTTTISAKILAIKPILDSDFYKARYALSVYLLLKTHLPAANTYIGEAASYQHLTTFLTKHIPEIIADVFKNFEIYKKYETELNTIPKWLENLAQNNPQIDLKNFLHFNRVDFPKRETQFWQETTQNLSDSHKKNLSITQLNLSTQPTNNTILTDPSLDIEELLDLCTQLKEVYQDLIPKREIAKTITNGLLDFVDIMLIDFSHKIGFPTFLFEYATLCKKPRGHRTPDGLSTAEAFQKLDFTPLDNLSRVITNADQSVIRSTPFYQSFSISSTSFNSKLGNASLQIWSKRILNHKALSYEIHPNIKKLISEIEIHFALYSLHQRFQHIAKTMRTYPTRLHTSFTKIVECAQFPQDKLPKLSSQDWSAWLEKRTIKEDSLTIKPLLKEWAVLKEKHCDFFQNNQSNRACITLNNALEEEAGYQAVREMVELRNQQTFSLSPKFFTQNNQLPLPNYILGMRLINLCIKTKKVYQSIEQDILESKEPKNIGSICLKGINKAFKLLQTQLVEQMVEQLVKANNKANRPKDASLQDYIKATITGYNPTVEYHHSPEWEHYKTAFDKIQYGIERNEDDIYFQALIQEHFDASSDLALTPNPPATPITATTDYLSPPPTERRSRSKRPRR